MAFNNFSMLLLLEVVYISSAALQWPEQPTLYANLGEAFDETGEIQNKPVETSEDEPINSSISNHRKLFARENRRQEEDAIIPKPHVRSLFESFYTRSKNFPLKSNPLCFFSALPCKPRRKDVYYVPRKYLSQM